MRIITALLLCGAGIASASLPDVCTLVPKTYLERAAGVALGNVSLHVRNDGAASCEFQGHGRARIAILLRQTKPQWVTEQVARMERGVNWGSYRETRGIGDRAFVLEMKTSAVLCIFQDDYYLQITGEPAHRQQLEELGRMALCRLVGRGR